jgi:hypothetical protein
MNKELDGIVIVSIAILTYGAVGSVPSSIGGHGGRNSIAPGIMALP